MTTDLFERVAAAAERPLRELERELAALVGAPEPSALRLYLAELVRERDRCQARVLVLEGRLERMAVLARGGADPLMLEVETMRAALDAARGQVP